MSPHRFRLKDGSFVRHEFIDGVFRVFRWSQDRIEQTFARPGATYLNAGHRNAPVTTERDAEALDQIREVMGLSEAELGDLFGVRRESIIGWRRNGIPDARRAKVASLLDLARILFRDIKPDRIPEIVRKQDDWLEHGTILETVKREGVAPIYSYLRRLFAYEG